MARGVGHPQPLGGLPGLGRDCLLLVTQAQASPSQAQAIPTSTHSQVHCCPTWTWPSNRNTSCPGLGRNHFHSFISERRADRSLEGSRAGLPGPTQAGGAALRGAPRGRHFRTLWLGPGFHEGQPCVGRTCVRFHPEPTKCQSCCRKSRSQRPRQAYPEPGSA